MVVKLKMKPIYKTGLFLIGSLILVLMLLGISFILYDKAKNMGYEVEVDGNLSINYIDGKTFEIKNEEILSFSVINASDDVMYYNINLVELNDKIDYILYDDNDKELEKGSIKYGDKSILTNLSIEAKKEDKYKIKLINKSKKDFVKGKIEVDVIEQVVVTFADIIIENNKVSDKSLTKPGAEISVTDEGLIKEQDDFGTSYYFRGNIQNNYVLFADNMWRIVRINGDGTVRIVLNNLTDNVSNIHADATNDFKYDNSAIKDYLAIWFDDNLKDYESYVANGNYCKDYTHDESFVFQASTRLKVNYIPTFNCLGETYSSNIGLLSADEVLLAGGKYNEINKNYYLHNLEIKEDYFTMTTSSGNANSLNMFMVNVDGALSDEVNSSLFRGVRPVINLIKNIEVSGNGTELNPYVIVENE